MNIQKKKIHFSGIGGVGMYSLARLSLEQGYCISGSDLRLNSFTEDLCSRGATVHIGHLSSNIVDQNFLVYSLSIAGDNPELTKARKLGIPTLTRAEYMAKLMEPYRNHIAVSGSHGKSTVTSMLYHIFRSLRLFPTVIAGVPIEGGLPIALGGLDYLIYEACEYKDSFLKFSPTSVTVTNLELDHTDYFKSLDAIKASFLKSINSADRFAVINTDDPNLYSMLDSFEPEIITVGAYGESDLKYELTSFDKGKMGYTIRYLNKYVGDYSIIIPGYFNVSNAAVAIATAYGYGIPLSDSARALESFKGAPRRMEHIGYRGSRPVYYDYAHHPTEIAAVINSLKALTGKVTVIFRPHTYTRTRDLWDEFVRSLSQADHLILTDVFAAREEPIVGIDSKSLAAESGGIYCTDNDVEYAVDRYTSGAIVLMGAGDLEGVKNKILKIEDSY